MPIMHSSCRNHTFSILSVSQANDITLFYGLWSFSVMQIRLDWKFKQIFLMIQNQLKEGNVVTYQVLQNTITYQVRLTNTSKGLWMCIEDAGLNWKLTITPQMLEQTVSKASAHQQTLALKDFTTFLLQAITKSSEKWSIGIMTPVQLQVLRGGTPSKQANNSKIYLILSDKQKKFHYPFTFVMSEVSEKDKLLEAIKTMKSQLQELKAEKNDKSQSSFSIMSETYNNSEQIRMQNQEMKKKIRMYEESLTQKRGAVEIDLILKEKNNLEIKAETKKRQENKQITRLKNIFYMMERQIKQIENEVEMTNRQLLMFEDNVGNAAKIKSHAMKVLKSYQTECRTQKKVLQKQTKEIEALKRNILNSKNNQRKVLAKIKQIQAEIDQCKKKANIKQISNRLHSVGKSRNGSSVDSGSSKQQSMGGNSSTGKAPKSDTSGRRVQGNLVRENLLRKNMPLSSSNRNNNLLRTSPNMTPMAMKKTASDNPAVGGRAINSSHQVPGPKLSTGTNPRLYNTQKYNRSGSKSQGEGSVRSDSGKKQMTQEQKERQRKAMERLAGPRANVPKAPSNEKKTQSVNRATSQTRGSTSANKGGPMNKGGSLTKPGMGGMKKDSAKELLLKMKEIKAHYNGQAKNNTTSKNIVAKISDLSDKKQV